MTILIKSLVLIFIFGSTIFGQVSAKLMQFPDVSKTQITFSYGGNLWIVSKEGGIAHKLSSPKGQELFPKFSTDGSKIAFSGNYNGNLDIYVISSKGGLPQRITYHPMPDYLIDWYPDSDELLFSSSRKSGRQRFHQLFNIKIGKPLPEKLPVPYGEFGSISEDGKLLAYTFRSRLFRTWKRYRGGMAADIWLFNLKDYSSVNITNNDANDELPMWHGNKIYFLSDRDKNERFNIWVYDINLKSTTQLTFFDSFDVHFPSIGPDDIVFEAGGDLYLLNLSTLKYNKVEIKLYSDQITKIEKVKNVSKLIRNFSISPSGKRVIFEARGELFSVPEKSGVIKNLTNSDGIAERFPSWSPDGKFVAFWSDKSGEYELYIKKLDTLNKVSKITDIGKGFKYHLYWSPNSKKIVFVDNSMKINLIDIKTKEITTIDRGLYMFEGNLENFSVSWSADSKFVAYSRGLTNQHNAILIYDLENSIVNQVTSGFYNDFNPTFDPESKYLFYLTDRNFKPVYSSVDNTFSYPNTTKIAAVALTDKIKSLLSPKNDVQEIKKDDKKDKGKDENKSGNKEEKERKVNIDFDNFENRAVILPIDPGKYLNLTAIKGKIVYHKFPNSGSSLKEKLIKYYDLEERKEKKILSDADRFMISANMEKMLVQKGKSFYIVDIKPDQKLDKKLASDNLGSKINPSKEWEQIFIDAWRMERDFFYDPNMHDVDWVKMREIYGQFIKDAVTRSDVNFLIGELIGEISSSHTYKGGGDLEKPDKMDIGLLGIDWAVNNRKYKIKHIINGAKWDINVKSPLSDPALAVKEGDYILAVNDMILETFKSPYSYFVGLADKEVELLVNNKPTLNGARKIVIKTLKSETKLRHNEWVEQKRKYVEDKTESKIGYIYVPNTGIEGQNELERQFLAQTDKQGLIIDERFNSGGQIPDRFIEILNRKPLAFWAVRDGRNWQWPPNAVFGPKVMLINGWSGSGGDAFPDYFRKVGLGPLIGQRTWGGLIGISGAPPLIDGGIVTVPTFRMYNSDGTWFEEGHGVDPDIEVVDNPTKMAKGSDPQLEAGIVEITKLLSSGKFKAPKQPPYQKR